MQVKLIICLALLFFCPTGDALCKGISPSKSKITATATNTHQLKQIEAWIADEAYEKAIAQCLKLLKKDNSATEQKPRIHLLLITALNQSGRYERALKESEVLYRSYRAIVENNKRMLKDFFFERAYTYSGLHNQKHEIDYTQKALAVMEADPKLFSDAEFISTYNDLYYYQLNYEDRKGLDITYQKYNDFFSRKHRLLRKIDYDHARRVLRKMEVTMALYQDQPDRATELLHRFQKEVEKPLTNRDMAYLNSCYSHLNNYYYFAEDYKNSIAFGKEYLSFAKKTDSNFDVMLAYSKIGASYEQLGNYDQAIRYIDLSMQAFEFGEFNASKYALNLIRAKALSGKKQYLESCQLAEDNIQEILSHKLKRPTTISDFKIADITNLNSHNYINIFATGGLLFLEKHKHSAQLADLDKAEKLLKASSAMFREFYLKGEYNPTLYKLHLKNAEGLLYIAAKKYPNDQQQLIAILDIIEGNVSKHLYKNYLKKAASFGRQDIGMDHENLEKLIGSVQKQLTNEEQLLKYYVTPNDIYVVQLDRSHVKLQRMASTSTVQQAVVTFGEDLEQLKDGYKDQSSLLAKLLLPGELGSKLTVIPDNFLNYIPFEALRIPNSGKFLIQQHELSYAYSLAILNWNRNVQLPVNEKKALIFNPIYQQDASYQGIPLPPLPWSYKESNQIAKTLDGKRISGQVGKADFIKRSKDYPIYHFAMHAYLDQENFKKSCLVFSTDEPLFFEELYQMHIPAELIVLAACNTGNGKLKNGEGIMSLSMAFSFAGTRSSIFSLWKVPDAETAQLLGVFYTHLKNGHTKDEALALAKRDFIQNNPMKSHPFFWAGFIVNGDTAALFTKPSWNWYLGSAVILSVLVLIFVFRKRLRA